MLAGSVILHPLGFYFCKIKTAAFQKRLDVDVINFTGAASP
jgi:hypothetical protein